MIDLDTREWLLTNGFGGFASGTVSDVRTRTYHGWLLAATNPPSGRKLLLSHLEARLEIPGKEIALGTNFWSSGEIEPTGYKLLHYFDINPVPKWVWGEDNWQLSRQLVMPNGWGLGTGDWGLGEKGKVCANAQRILIQYRYEGKEAAILRLRLLISDRNFHHQQSESEKLQFSQLVSQQLVCLQANHSGQFGTPWHLRWTQGVYKTDGVWYWNYSLSEETKRGLGDREDLYSPGYLTVNLQPGDTVTLEAKLGLPDPQPILSPDSFAEAVEAEQERLSQIFGWRLEEAGGRGAGEQGAGEQGAGGQGAGSREQGAGGQGSRGQGSREQGSRGRKTNPQFPVPSPQSPITSPLFTKNYLKLVINLLSIVLLLGDQQ